jgi:GAF domain-containing protein
VNEGPADQPGPGRRDRVALVDALLAAAADRVSVAIRLEPPGLERILRSIVDATAALFDAEAASIALAEDDGRLRFRVAAGDRGQGVVGMTVNPGEGVAGYVASTGQPLALTDVARDPRFGRATAEATGYVPNSILAVPLELDDRVIGVLEVLDKRDGGGFDLADINRAAIFARQAAVAIDASRIERDVRRMLADGLAAIAGGPAHAPDDIAALLASALASDDPESTAFWTLVDRIAGLRAADPASLGLVGDLLEVAAHHLGRPTAQSRRGSGATWRDRAGLGGDDR